MYDRVTEQGLPNGNKIAVEFLVRRVHVGLDDVTKDINGLRSAYVDVLTNALKQYRVALFVTAANTILLCFSTKLTLRVARV